MYTRNQLLALTLALVGAVSAIVVLLSQNRLIRWVLTVLHLVTGLTVALETRNQIPEVSFHD